MNMISREFLDEIKDLALKESSEDNPYDDVQERAEVKVVLFARWLWREFKKADQL